MSRSQLIITRFSLGFCASSISPLPLEGFSLKVSKNDREIPPSHTADQPTAHQGPRLQLKVSNNQRDEWMVGLVLKGYLHLCPRMDFL